MKYENIEKFREFLDKNLKRKGEYNFSACLEDFERQIGASGGQTYELSPFETFSGHAEEIGFERIDKFFIDDQEVSGENNDFDYGETTIIF